MSERILTFDANDVCMCMYFAGVIATTMDGK